MAWQVGKLLMVEPPRSDRFSNHHESVTEWSEELQTSLRDRRFRVLCDQ